MKTLWLVIVLLIPMDVFAQSSSRFTITRSVVASGGATFSSSARFQLGGTVAQPLAAVPASARFSILGGFWIRFSPVLFASGASGTNFVASIQTELGGNYTVQYTTSLAPQNWQTLASFTGNGGVMTVTNSTAGVTNRFFRLVEQ